MTEGARLTTRRLTPEYFPLWDDLPDDVLLHIFSYLQFKHIATAACVCCSWQRVAYDELLWRRVFRTHFSVPRSIGMADGQSSWREEFIRLYSKAPTVHLQTIVSHTDQVLHVSFSHDGKLFATSSKDGCIKVWNSNHPVTLRYSKDMNIFSWKYTQFSQFNENDTLLLVSGVYFGPNIETSTAGEVAIFSLRDPNVFDLQCRVRNKPYDVFGTWYSEKYLLSGNLKWLETINGHDIWSCSMISLNYAFQATESEEHSVICRLFKFKNINSSTIRSLMVADPSKWYSDKMHSALPTDDVEMEIETESPRQNCDIESESESEDTSTVTTNELEFGAGNGDKSGEKLLIFTKGDRTYSPHVIGVKRLPIYEWAETTGMRDPPNVDFANYRTLRDTEFDQVDHSFEMNGHIIGVALSPNHRYLYANVRSWPVNAEISDPMRPPPIAQEIDIHVIDLCTLTLTPHVYRSHRAFTPDDDCFFIFLDVSKEYLASGAEDKFAYVWDRHYLSLLAKFSHDDVVNSVAFNPGDQETLVTVSDDCTIKVWTSRNRRRSLGLRTDVEDGHLFCHEEMTDHDENLSNTFEDEMVNSLARAVEHAIKGLEDEDE